jgi:hypothetical protein
LSPRLKELPPKEYQQAFPNGRRPYPVRPSSRTGTILASFLYAEEVFQALYDAIRGDEPHIGQRRLQLQDWSLNWVHTAVKCKPSPRYANTVFVLFNFTSFHFILQQQIQHEIILQLHVILLNMRSGPSSAHILEFSLLIQNSHPVIVTVMAYSDIAVAQTYPQLIEAIISPPLARLSNAVAPAKQPGIP